ncbi:hypothetical protein PR202_gb01816 [Eleusine coracana subsp. coracana]|uniref:Uncharacterized protein n=1 Tax=Eleusine coracana subsp. coracana TaxID=191504 RepID=A0AAV5DVC4_ELECO|nr:hypothetical protein PR202_gb01816 [Eleusine coracana subsp. coracana]
MALTNFILTVVGCGRGGDAAAERRQAVGHHLPPQRAPHTQLARGGVCRRRQVRSLLPPA